MQSAPKVKSPLCRCLTPSSPTLPMDSVPRQNRMTRLNIATINVNGLTKHVKRTNFIDFFILNKLDIIILTETKCSNRSHKNMKEEWLLKNNYKAQLFATPHKPSKGGVHGGTAILLRGRMADAKILSKKILKKYDAISIKVDVDGNIFKIIALYCPNNENDRAAFLKDIFEEETDGDECKTIYGGDFNFVPDIHLDKYYYDKTVRRKGRETRGILEVNTFNEVHDCVDAWRYRYPTAHGFTYSHTKRPKDTITTTTQLEPQAENTSTLDEEDTQSDDEAEALSEPEDDPISNEPPKKLETKSRIDRIYIPKPTKVDYKCRIKEPPKTTIKKRNGTLEYKPSTDHHALIIEDVKIEGGERRKKGPGLWKLNCELLDHQDYIKGIQDIYVETFENQHSNDILETWDIFKAKVQHFSIYSAAKFKLDRDKELIKAEKDLNRENQQAENPLDDYETTLRQRKLDKYKSLLAVEETRKVEALRIKAKLDKIEGDERGTKYFADRLKKRNENRQITILKDENGQTHKKDADIMNTIHKFYKELFTKSDDISMPAQEKILDNIEIKLTTEERQYLEQPIVRQDIYSAIKHMPKDKTPGIDGLPKEFYFKFQDLLIEKLIEIANFIQTNERKADSHKLSYIALIFKKGEKDNLKNWRPISLINCDWKIITKAHANNLKRILPTIIQPDQTAGIPGRSIRDNQWATRDILEYGHQTETPGVIVSLDAEKAFDRVDHEYLLVVLAKMGFGPKFISIVKTIISDNETMVLNNGYLSKKIPITRGTRQGCPISAYLYVIVAETLAIAIRKEEGIKGYPRPPGVEGETKVSLYADDTINYLDATPTILSNSLTALSKVLDVYQSASGSKFNDSKTEIIHFGSKDLENAATYTRACLKKLNSSIRMWKVITIEDTFRSLGIDYGKTIADTKQLNYSKLVTALSKNLRFLALRKLSIKGRSIALKTQALSLLWSTASVVPISSIGSSSGRGGIDYLGKIVEIATKYIWQPISTSPTTLNQRTLQLPYKLGGLNCFNIGTQANSLLMSQIPAILDPENNRPSAVYARYWIAKNKNFYAELAKRIPELSFLDTLNHTHRANQYLVTENIGTFLQWIGIDRNTKLYVEERKPTNKDIYKAITHNIPSQSTVEIKCHGRWTDALKTIKYLPLRVNVPLETWHSRSPCTNFTLQYLWRTRHFCLVLNEKIANDRREDQFYLKCHVCHPTEAYRRKPSDKSLSAPQEPLETQVVLVETLDDSEEESLGREPPERTLPGAPEPWLDGLPSRETTLNQLERLEDEPNLRRPPQRTVQQIDNTHFETHIHTLATCKKVTPIWTLVRQLLKRVCDKPYTSTFENPDDPSPYCQPHDAQTVPPRNYELILGVRVRPKSRYRDKPRLGWFIDKPSIHLNAIVALTLHEIWRDRNLVRHEGKKNRSAKSIFHKVKGRYKRWLELQYDVLLRRGDVTVDWEWETLTPKQQFVKYYQINNICLAKEDRLEFKI